MKSGLLFLTALPLLAQSSLYVVAGAAKEYVVGAKLAASGLFRQTPTNTWEHLGYTVPFMFGLDYDPNDPSIIYMAAGNGLIRGANGGKDWTLVTGSDITELRDLVVTPTAIYIAHSRGIRVSKDRGKTWAELSGKLHRKFTEALRVDRTNPSVLQRAISCSARSTPPARRAVSAVSSTCFRRRSIRPSAAPSPST